MRLSRTVRVCTGRRQATLPVCCADIFPPAAHVDSAGTHLRSGLLRHLWQRLHVQVPRLPPARPYLPHLVVPQRRISRVQPAANTVISDADLLQHTPTTCSTPPLNVVEEEEHRAAPAACCARRAVQWRGPSSVRALALHLVEQAQLRHEARVGAGDGVLLPQGGQRLVRRQALAGHEVRAHRLHGAGMRHVICSTFPHVQVQYSSSMDSKLQHPVFLHIVTVIGPQMTHAGMPPLPILWHEHATRTFTCKCLLVKRVLSLRPLLPATASKNRSAGMLIRAQRTHGGAA